MSVEVLGVVLGALGAVVAFGWIFSSWFQEHFTPPERTPEPADRLLAEE